MGFLKRWISHKKSVSTLKREKDFLGLNDALDDDNMRKKATKALVDFGSEAVGTLLDAVNKHNELILNAVNDGDRVKADLLMISLGFRIDVLGRIADERAIPVLIDSLTLIVVSHIPIEVFQANKREKIKKYVDPNYLPDKPLNMQLLEDEHQRSRQLRIAYLVTLAIGAAFRAIGTPAIQPLIKALGDKAHPARLEIAEILLLIGGLEIADTLMTVLDETDDDLRQKILEAVEEQKSKGWTELPQ